MSLSKKIIIGLIATFLLFFILIDRFTLYLHKQEEHQIDNIYDHIISEADSAIEEASKRIEEFKNLRISKDKEKREMDSLISKMKKEKDVNKYREYAIDIFQLKIEDNIILIDSLKERCLMLEKELEYRPDSLKYNIIYEDSTIWNYVYDTAKIEIIIADTIKIEDDKTIKRIKNKYLD